MNPDANRFELVEYEESLQRLGGDKALFVEFIEIFMADSPKLINDINEAAKQSDCSRLEKSAHALKGLMSNFGAQTCCASALAIEIDGRKERLDDLQTDVAKLSKLYDQLCGELNSCLR